MLPDWLQVINCPNMKHQSVPQSTAVMTRITSTYKPVTTITSTYKPVLASRKFSDAEIFQFKVPP